MNKKNEINFIYFFTSCNGLCICLRIVICFYLLLKIICHKKANANFFTFSPILIRNFIFFSIVMQPFVNENCLIDKINTK